MTRVGRELVGRPVLVQDWDDADEERGALFWELFLDLLLVAAASAVADGYEDSEKHNPAGLAEFAVLYFTFANGWMLYTHHYTARFEDSTLLHSLVLFFYLLGMACCVVNANYDTAVAFSVGAILMRGSVLVMLGVVAACIPRARDFCLVLGLITLATILCFTVTFFWNDLAPKLWWMAAIIELGTEAIMLLFLPGEKLVPVNIEHSKDRLGCLILIMLGETVLSSTITYMMAREEREESNPDNDNYYSVLGLCFLLIFTFTLLYFHMNPAPENHAFRRSRMRGMLTLMAHKFLGLALLALGVSVKLTVEAVAKGHNLSDFASKLMGLSVGFSLLILYCIRILHYGGKLPRPEDPPNVARLYTLWWWTFGLACIVPFLAVGAGLHDPVVAMATYTGLILALCVIESSYSHLLMPFLPGNDARGEEGEGTARREQETIIGDSEVEALKCTPQCSYMT